MGISVGDGRRSVRRILTALAIVSGTAVLCAVSVRQCPVPEPAYAIICPAGVGTCQVSDVNEFSTMRVRAKFKDFNGIVITPTTLSWWVHDKTTGELLGSGTETPTDSDVRWNVPASAARIVDPVTNTEQEPHLLSLLWTWPSGQSSGQVEFDVNNLKHLPTATPTPTSTPTATPT